MVVSRWGRWIGIGIGVMVMAVGATATAIGAREGPWDPPSCAGPVSWTKVPEGTWWRMDPLLAGGQLTGQRLLVGKPGSGPARWLDLPPESFAAGPFDGRVLVGTDDGRRSTLRVLDPVADCARTIATSEAVIRRATITPDRRAVLEMRVTRAGRVDQGVYRRSLILADRVRQVLPPITPDARFGPTWSTEFTWSLDGRRVAVQSCGAEACRTRVMDPDGRDPWSVADPSHGDLIGVAGDRLLLYAACGGSPCPILAVDRGGRKTTLVAEAGPASIGTDAGGRAVVFFEEGQRPDRLGAVTVDGPSRVATDLHHYLDGRRLVPPSTRAGGAVERRSDQIVLGPDGRVVTTAATDLVLLPVSEVQP